MASAAGCGLRASRRAAPRRAAGKPRKVTITAMPSPPTPGAPRLPVTPSPPPLPPPLLPPPPWPATTTTTSLPLRGTRRAANAARGASRATKATATRKGTAGSPARRSRMLLGSAGAHPSTRSASTSSRPGRSPRHKDKGMKEEAPGSWLLICAAHRL
uniref:Uncharacterized protein n=1 Tax=Oryctolagus cuniculus TaxID=9986 RepID=A0A5F9DPC9_RABIT